MNSNGRLLRPISRLVSVSVPVSVSADTRKYRYRYRPIPKLGYRSTTNYNVNLNLFTIKVVKLNIATKTYISLITQINYLEQGSAKKISKSHKNCERFEIRALLVNWVYFVVTISHDKKILFYAIFLVKLEGVDQLNVLWKQRHIKSIQEKKIQNIEKN